MLGLFWRFPLPTCVASIALLGGLLRIVRFARLIDPWSAAEDREGAGFDELDPRLHHPDSGATTI
jgi:hypothetical protein